MRNLIGFYGARAGRIRHIQERRRLAGARARAAGGAARIEYSEARMTAALVANAGRSAWFVGVLIITVYVIFAMTLYLLPPRIS